jgi:alpha-maltose-1-phosphate synthase
MSDLCLSLVHYGNAANARQAALAFAESDLLKSAITTIAYQPDAPAWKYLQLLPSSVAKAIDREFSKRTWEIPDGKIETYPWYELLRLLILKTKLDRLLGVSSDRSIDRGFRLLDRWVAEHNLERVDAIYAYEDLAATTFAAAKQRNILCLYDLAIPFYRTTQKIMEEEATLFPSLRKSITSVNEPEWKIERKQQEIELADRIFVASSVTQKSLIDVGIDSDKISVIPYGSPVDSFQPQPKLDDVFRPMFVGKISPLKGIHYLLQAWQQLKLPNSELLLVGDDLFPSGWLDSNYSGLYRQIASVSHFSLNKYYAQASVLVLPSLIDGFGLVVLEAMACGIPTIVTANTGASDIVSDGIDGFIIPIRDVAAIAEKLEWCYGHPQELAQMGRAARQKAEELNWGLYRQRLASQVRSILPVKSHHRAITS